MGWGSIFARTGGKGVGCRLGLGIDYSDPNFLPVIPTDPPYSAGSGGQPEAGQPLAEIS